MILSDTASLHGLHPMMQIANARAAVIWDRHGKELFITHTFDGKHMKGSLHPKGRACDYRTNYFDSDTSIVQEIAQELREILGNDYDVIAHSTHIHIEYDPKNPKII